MKPVLIILCGAPASGKTTLSKKLAKDYNFTRISMDEEGYFFHSELIPTIITSMKKKENIIVDALYTKLEWRKDLIEITDGFEYNRILIYINTPLYDCIHRNSKRENPLPDFVVEDIYKSIDSPNMDEGWDEIIYY